MSYFQKMHKLFFAQIVYKTQNFLISSEPLLRIIVAHIGISKINEVILLMLKQYLFFTLLAALLFLPSEHALSQRLRFDEIEAGQKEIAIFVGYGENHRIPHATKELFSFDTAKIRFGRFVSPKNEVALDISAGKLDASQINSAVWVTMTFRQLFLVRGSTAISWDASFGIMYLQKRVSSLGTKTNFTEQLGLTLQYATGPTTAISIEYKFYHASNGGIKLPNIGINASVASAGYSWYF